MTTTASGTAIVTGGARGIGRPEDIAHLVSYLVSEGAGFVSGQVVYATGGRR